MIYIVTNPYAISFSKVARLSAEALRSIGYIDVYLYSIYPAFLPYSGTRIVVEDTVSVARPYIQSKVRGSILWVDSPLDYTGISFRDDTCVYTCLPFWYRRYREDGIKIDGYIPRPVDVDLSRKALEYDCRRYRSVYGDYIVNVSTDIPGCRKPRKGLDMFDALCEHMRGRVRCVAVTNIPLRNSYTIKSGTLSDLDILGLIRCAKLFVWTSRSEGFGMPPIEAMSVKQLVVSSNAPFNELIIGIKFDYDGEELVPLRYGYRYIAFDYSLRSLVEAVDYALSLSDDERDGIVSKAYELAKYMDKMYVALALNRVITHVKPGVCNS